MELVAFSYGFINIYWYGVVILVAILCGLMISKFFFKVYNEDFKPIWELLVWTIPCCLICARISYIIIHMEIYLHNWEQIFSVWQGGLSIYGALVGFLVASILYLRKYDYNIWLYFDLLMPAILFGLMLLQIANFMMQFSVGMPLGLDLPDDHSLAEYVEYRYRPTGFEAYQYFQPVALYQAFAYLVVYIVVSAILLINKKLKLFAQGTIFLYSIILLAIIRFGLGFMYFSVDRDIVLYPIQWLSLIVIVITLGFYWGKRLHKI